MPALLWRVHNSLDSTVTAGTLSIEKGIQKRKAKEKKGRGEGLTRVLIDHSQLTNFFYFKYNQKALLFVFSIIQRLYNFNLYVRLGCLWRFKNYSKEKLLRRNYRRMKE